MIWIIQLTLKQHRFEMHTPTCTWILFSVDGRCGPEGSVVVESVNAEPGCRANSKVKVILRLSGASNPHVVQGSSVTLRI